VDGTEGYGKVLVSDSAGLASWEEPSSRVVTMRDEPTSLFDGGILNGWNSVSTTSDWLDVEPGDVIIIHADFRCQIVSGSSNDAVHFRIALEGNSGCLSTTGYTTGSLDFDAVRGSFMPVHVQHTETVSCSGQYRFTVEAFFDDTDDPVEIANVTLSAVRY